MSPLLVLSIGLGLFSPANAAPKSVEISAPIVGGVPAESAGAVAAIFRDSTFGCSGTLITPRHVLTAGHCGSGITHVILDALDWVNNGTRIEVVETIIYEKYWVNYDIAILELAEEAPIPPQPLLLDCLVDNYLYDGAPARLAGFGAIDSQGIEFGSELMSAETAVVDAECTDFNFGCNEDVSPGGELVVGGDGVDSCIGDSGGPVFIMTELGERLIGVTSRGIDQATSVCGDGGIYARPDAVVDWLEEQTGYTLERPDCSNLNDAPIPTAASIRAIEVIGGLTVISPNDPDPDDQHRFQLIGPPLNGQARVSDLGTVHYIPTPGAEHDVDELTVRVVDEGDPALFNDLTIAVTIQRSDPVAHQCGCATGAPVTPLPWVLLFAFRRRS
jgi:hypothetical protein